MIGRKLFLFIAAAVLSVGICIYGIENTAHDVKPLSESTIEKAGIKDSRNLMIIAHPDDETLWGGGHLMDGDYFVVCITNGRNNERKEEFQQALEASGNRGIILNYPDKVLGIRDDWSKVKSGIISDLELIMDFNDWETVVTHNPDGEYGHQHHKMTSEIVTEIFENWDKNSESELWYFGNYYKASEIAEVMTALESISDDKLEYKENLEKIYGSQSETIDKLSHMNKYEDWRKYGE